MCCIRTIAHHRQGTQEVRQTSLRVWTCVHGSSLCASVLRSCPCSGFDWEEGSIGIDSGSQNSRAQDLSNILRGRAAAYRTRHLLVPFGDDFKFKNAERQFSNMDRLMEVINSNPSQYGMKIQYSTLSDYFAAVAASGVKFPLVAGGDFFPYADNEDSYWTGYYTTRPLLKAKSRKLNHILRACEGLLVLVRSSPRSNLDTERHTLPLQFWEDQLKAIEGARAETALFLHHDAITGTSRTQVVADYMNRMDQSTEALMRIQARMIEHLLTKEPNPPPSFTHDALTFTPPQGGGEDLHPVVFYNSLGWVRREVVSVRTTSRNTRIFSAANEEVPCQIDVVWSELGNEALAPSANLFSVSFLAEIPPLGATTYFVSVGSGSAPPEPHKVTMSFTSVHVSPIMRSRGEQSYTSKFLRYTDYNPSEQCVQNRYLKACFDSDTGLVNSVEELAPSRAELKGPFEFRQRFGKYATSRSGAYIFRPQNAAEMYQPDAGKQTTLRITRGPIVSRVAVQFHGVDVIYELMGDADVSEELGGHLSVVSSVAVEAGNQEVVCVFSSATLLSSGTAREFTTNSGLDFVKRASKDGNQAANFYPMVLGARMEGKRDGKGYTIVSGHSMAVGSQKDGELELMMHRSLAQDDGRGLSEPVNDNSRLEVPLWVAFESGASDFRFKRLSIRMNNPLRAFYKVAAPQAADSFFNHDHVESAEAWAQRQHVTISPLRAELPPHVHLLSLLARDSVSDDIVMRFQHLDSRRDSQWVGSLGEVFESTYSVSEVRRATLSLNTLLPLSTGHHKRTFTFEKAEGEASSPYEVLASWVGGGGGGGAATDSQNTNEEGVFLSQAALEKLRQDQEAARAAQSAAARRMLWSQVEAEPDLVDMRAVIHAQEERATSPATPLSPFVSRAPAESDLSSPSAASPGSSRHLLASASSGGTPLFVLKPLQIHTYIFRLVGSDWAESNEGVMVGVGHTSDGKVAVQKRPAYAKPTPIAVKTDVTQQQQILTKPPITSQSNPSSLLPPLTRPSLDGGALGGMPSPAGAGNVLHGHEHTVIPGRTHEAWRLIPSRWEYMVVLVASLAGVAFFLQALRIMARAGTDMAALPSSTRPAVRKHAAH